MKIEDLSQMLAAIGPTLSPCVIDEHAEGMTFGIRFEDRTQLLIERDENRETLVLVGSLGPARSDEEGDKLCLMFMRFNTLWGQLGGLRFGYEDGGEFKLFLDLPYGPLTQGSLATLIESFAERTAFWSDVVVKGAPDPEGHLPYDANDADIIRA
ncbi:MAG: type III secretion system chaperone [Pseudomonadota bacterium]